jgi:hypothetical protein
MGLSPTRIRDFLYFTVAIEPVLYINWIQVTCKYELLLDYIFPPRTVINRLSTIPQTNITINTYNMIVDIYLQKR